MSLKDLLIGVPAEKLEQLVALLKQREAAAKQLADLDAQIEAFAGKGAGKGAKGGKNRRPSVEIPELLAKFPEGLTTREIMDNLRMSYPSVYTTLVKLKKAKKVVVNEESGKYSLKATAADKKAK